MHATNGGRRAEWASGGKAVSRSDLRERCAAKLLEYGLAPPTTLDMLQQKIERARDRVIRFVPVQTSGASKCGLWISVGDTDLVLHEQATSPLHTLHIKLHELAHMLWGHPGTSPFAPEFLRLVVPDLDPAAVRQVLGRGGDYTTDAAEAEAEMTATLLAEAGAYRVGPPAAPAPDLPGPLHRLASALGNPAGGSW